MSVTISIRGNQSYCRKNGLDREEAVPCGCGPATDCPDCGGTGRITFLTFPFELNLTNANFAAVWNALGIAQDWAGSLDGRALAARLATADADQIAASRTPRVSETPDGPRMVEFGIRPIQAACYLDSLAEIAAEAERREEPVVWA